MERKSQRIEVVVADAERYLGLQDLTSEVLQGVLGCDVPSFQIVGMVGLSKSNQLHTHG